MEGGHGENILFSGSREIQSEKGLLREATVWKGSACVLELERLLFEVIG